MKNKLVSVSEKNKVLLNNEGKKKSIEPEKLLDSSLDVICCIDASGVFTYVSAASKHVWGYTPQEVVGKKYMDMVLPEDHPKTIATATAIICGQEVTSFENRYRKKDGSIVPILWSATWNKEEQTMYGVAKDATQIKDLEKKKHHQERRLRSAYRLAEIAWWEFDVASQTYTSSDEIFEMYGLPIPPNNQTTLGEFLSYVHPDDVLRLQHDLSLVCQDTYIHYEHRIVKPSGDVIYVMHDSEVIRDEEGNPVSIHGATKEITKSKYYSELEKLERQILEMSVSKTNDLIALLTEYVKGIQNIHEGIICSISQNRGGRLYLLTAPSIPASYLDLVKDGVCIANNNGSCGTAAYLKEKVVVSDIATDLRWANWKDAALTHGYKACWATPIMDYDNNVIAIFAMYYKKPKSPSELEENTLKRASNILQIILENHRKSEALLLANERFNLASKATSDALWDWDLATDDVYFSSNYTALFGHGGKSDNIYNAWGEHVHPEDWTSTLASLQKAIGDTSVQQWEVGCRFHRKDKCIAYVYNRGYIIRDRAGKAVRMVGSIQDITKLKEAECAMAKSERRFKAMVQSGKDLIMLLNASFEVIYTSPNYLAATGYTHEELSGLLSHDKVHPDDNDMLINASKNIFTTSIVPLPLFRFQTKGGEYRWYEATLSNHLNNPDIEAIVSNVRDVTARVAAEEEMKKLSLVAKETANIVIITDADDNITWVNKAFTDVMGYTLDEVYGKKPKDLLQGPKTSERTRSYLKKCVEKQQPFNCEILNYTKSGMECWLEVKGQPLFDEKGELKQFFAIQTDITARKEAEEAIKKSEEKYRLLFHNSPRPKWIFNAETYQVVDVNKAAVELYGYNREEFLTLKIYDIKKAEDKAELLSAAQELKSGERSIFSKIVSHKKKSGETFYIEITSFPIELATGVHFMVTGTDMTEKLYLQQKLIEEKVAAQKKVARAIIHAQETERAEIGKELHDNVCQLLTTAKLYIENIKHMPLQQEEFTRKGIELLIQSINEIRYLSRQLVTPVLNNDDFEASVNELLTHYKSLNLFEIDFRYEANVELLDKDLKTSVIRILQEEFNNTVKYAKASRVQVSICTTNATLLLRYEDNGVGFDPTSTKKGIGLANITNRADAYRGTVKLDTAIGKGCKIDILFPLTEKAAFLGLAV